QQFAVEGQLALDDAGAMPPVEGHAATEEHHELCTARQRSCDGRRRRTPHARHRRRATARIMWLMKDAGASSATARQAALYAREPFENSGKFHCSMRPAPVSLAIGRTSST